MLKPLKIKNRRYKGGGGTTEASTIPEWAVPYLKNVGNTAEGEYNIANLGNVAGTNPLLQTAFNGGANAIGDTASRNLNALEASQGRLAGHAQSGGYDTSALKEGAIREAGKAIADIKTNFGDKGTLGSARQAVQEGEVDAATRAVFAKFDQDAAQQNFQNKMAAEGAITQQAPAAQGIAEGAAKSYLGLGTAARGIEQETGDAPWQALQRYATTIYGNPARQQTVASGGK